MTLKNQVQALKNASYVSFGFDKASGPNVISNPFPNHLRPKINPILESFLGGKKTCIKDVITSMRVIHEKLVQVRFLQPKRGEAVRKEELNRDYCLYHAEIQGIIYRNAMSSEKKCRI